MKIKRFFAPDIRQAMRMVREEQGPDAVILSNNRVNGGVEIVAAVDFDESMLRSATTATTVSDETRPTAAREAPAPEQMRRTEQSRDNVWSQEPTLVEMRAELASMRRMLESQLSSLAWGALTRKEPHRVELMQRLLQFGLSSAQCKAVADAAVSGTDDVEILWRNALAVITRGLPIFRQDILETGGVVALVGATGVGKTTTVAKLAARYAMKHGSRSVGLVTIDNYRVGAYEQLRTYGRLLDIPVRIAETRDELHGVLGDLGDRRLILIDTMGMGQRDRGLEAQAALLDKCDLDKKVFLLLSAASRSSGLDDVVSAFSIFRPDGCILTKIDESTCLGGTLSVTVKHQLPIAYTSDGQRVPEDLQVARADALVATAVGIMQQSGGDINEELAMLSFGKELSDAGV